MTPGILWLRSLAFPLKICLNLKNGVKITEFLLLQNCPGRGEEQAGVWAEMACSVLIADRGPHS